ncbi:O-methyltransferase [Chengkuizengella axinellae]|uniref:O-methyltransferase n=1 Tax=Chengkuizengella axinellae TaxID=3064388 RepID=A0ABT9IT94_9BACL|nr:O-methyltransferase [Chengkuizengella sp. 2205SS18-9]MDP5272533.1 O-methyltransferase [Chengkuizengella sp. 2205SS18-9]
MYIEQLSLARQLDLVFNEIQEELSSLSSGIVFLHIRNNTIGKFGVIHDPIQGCESKDLSFHQGLTSKQIYAFKKMAIHSLKYKSHWTHGQISFEFALKNKKLATSVQFESNYNMANLLSRSNENISSRC